MQIRNAFAHQSLVVLAATLLAGCSDSVDTSVGVQTGEFDFFVP